MNALLHQSLVIAAYVGFIVVVIGANLFILFYGPFVKWQKKPFGRHLFAFMLVLAAALNHDALNVFVPSYRGTTGNLIITTVLCWLMAWVVWWRLKILLVVQIGRRHGHSEHDHPEKIPQDSHDGLGSADGAHPDVVEGLNPLGRGDERLG